VISLVAYLDSDPGARLDFLLRRIDDPVPRVRAAAIQALGPLLDSPAGAPRREEGVERLMDLLDNEDPGVRGSAVSVLSNLRVTAALPKFKIMAKFDENEAVRKFAKWSVDVLEGRHQCSCQPKPAS
jgi:HEAT repeat protein